jgi:hypothetical protein
MTRRPITTELSLSKLTKLSHYKSLKAFSGYNYVEIYIIGNGINGDWLKGGAFWRSRVPVPIYARLFFNTENG